MKTKWKFSAVLFLMITLFACASFSYKYYGIDPASGLLLGTTPEEDLPLNQCQPDANSKGKCIVLFRAEFERLRADLIDAQERLKACESR